MRKTHANAINAPTMTSIKDIFRRCGDGSISDVQSGTEHDVLFFESEQTSDGVKTEEQKIEK